MKAAEGCVLGYNNGSAVKVPQAAAPPQSNVKKKSARTKICKAERTDEKRPNPFIRFDSKTASKDPRAGSPSFPAVAKKFKMAGRKKLMLQKHLSRATTPRAYRPSATAVGSALALLATLIWTAAIAVAVGEGVVPPTQATWDHAAPQYEPSVSNDAPPPL